MIYAPLWSGSPLSSDTPSYHLSPFGSILHQTYNLETFSTFQHHLKPFRAFWHHLALFSTIQLHSVSLVWHHSAPFRTILTSSTILPYSPPFITIWPHRYHSTAFGTFQHHSVSFATIKNHSIPLTLSRVMFQILS